MPEGRDDGPADGRADRRPAGGWRRACWPRCGRRARRSPPEPSNGNSAPASVTTILTRLHGRGVVTRARSGRGYAYAPAQDSPGLTARRMHAELDKDDDRGTALARFVSNLSPTDEETLRDPLEGGPGRDGGGR